MVKLHGTFTPGGEPVRFSKAPVGTLEQIGRFGVGFGRIPHVQAGLGEALRDRDLVEDSSGERQGHRHISRRGRAYARQLLYLAAMTAGRGALSAKRQRLVEDNNKPARVAIVANACALLRISHALVRDGVDFDAGRYAAATKVSMAA